MIFRPLLPSALLLRSPVSAATSPRSHLFSIPSFSGILPRRCLQSLAPLRSHRPSAAPSASTWLLRPFSAALKTPAASYIRMPPSLLPLIARRSYASSSQGVVNLVRDYGTVAVVVYFTLSFTVFWLCFASITFLGVNETHISAAFNYVKSFVGIKPADKAVEDASDAKPEKTILDMLPEWAKSPLVLRVGANMLLALLMTKLFIPIKVGITAAIVPSVARRFRAWGLNFGQQPTKKL